IDEPQEMLQKDMDQAKARFQAGLKVIGPSGEGTVDSINFPTAKDVAQYVAENPYAKLPVMLTIIMTCHLPKGSTTSSFRFPASMGSVVLTTEFPYTEPISESVDPGSASVPRQIPTQAQIDAAAAAIQANDLARANPPAAPSKSEAEVKKQIQAQYNVWSAAYMKNDVDTLLSILTPDYSIKASNGNLITHSEYEVILNQRKKKGYDATHYSTAILRVTLHGDIAAVWSRETSTIHGKSPQTGKIADTQYQHDYVDVWDFVNGKWLLKSTATLHETAQIKPPSK
ncbi:MAG TPA: nuclear transport factor 2 family protein, partial [Fimbriimonadaceae bacterium]|nr:nuclear transport factor 2 family protein [Fimbriimonadaceae bacterium]